MGHSKVRGFQSLPSNVRWLSIWNLQLKGSVTISCERVKPSGPSSMRAANNCLWHFLVDDIHLPTHLRAKMSPRTFMRASDVACFTKLEPKRGGKYGEKARMEWRSIQFRRSSIEIISKMRCWISLTGTKEHYSQRFTFKKPSFVSSIAFVSSASI